MLNWKWDVVCIKFFYKINKNIKNKERFLKRISLFCFFFSLEKLKHLSSNINPMIELNILELTNWYSWIARRKTWNRIKNIFIKDFELNKKISFDFKGIEFASHWFIDEIVWTVIFFYWKEALKQFEFKNCNNQVKEEIRFVVKDRLEDRIKDKKYLS